MRQMTDDNVASISETRIHETRRAQKVTVKKKPEAAARGAHKPTGERIKF